MVLPVDFETLWREELKNQKGEYSPRMTDDEVERDFWRRFMGKREHYVQDDWAVKMSEAVRGILKGYAPETILEIGPGWGNFTADLTGCCRRVTCVDISPDVLGFLKRALRKEGRPEIETVCSKWEDFVPKKRYDAVFGYNCFYRMLDLKECILRINNTAEKICVMGMGTGERRIYIYFVNMLFQLGIAANVLAVPLDQEPGSSSSMERRLGMLVYWEPRRDLEKKHSADLEIP